MRPTPGGPRLTTDAPQMPELSVVIPTTGSSDHLAQVLAGLERQDVAPEAFDVVVARDVAASGSPIDPIGVRALSIHQVAGTVPGASGTRNAGWRAAKAPLVLFLDDDIRPTRRLIAEHLAWHVRHPAPEVAVLGRVRWASELSVTPFMRWLDDGIQFDYGTIRGTEAGWTRLYSCNVSLKRSMLESVGGFDEEAFPFGYEDLDLGRRLDGQGLRLLYNRSAVGEHMRADSEEAWLRRVPRIAAAERRFVERYPDFRPYFYDLFRSAAEAPAPRGRAARLVRFVPKQVPWLGPVVWRGYDAVLRRAFAPAFLRAWENADRTATAP
jgi:GT2 family glycosyltransferase